MSPSMDQPRRSRFARHRAEPAAPLTPNPVAPQDTAPARGAHAAPIAPVNTKPVSDEPESARVVESLETAPIGVAPAPATSVSTPSAASPETALISVAPAVRKRTNRVGTAPGKAPRAERVAPFSSEPHAVLKKAASVRLMSHRMAVVAGALAVLLGVGSAGQASELPFFGKESSGHDTAASTDETAPTTATSSPQATPTAALPKESAAAPKPSTSPGRASVAAPDIGHAPAGAFSVADAVRAVRATAGVKLPVPADPLSASAAIPAAPATASPSSSAAPSTAASPTPTPSPTSTASASTASASPTAPTAAATADAISAQAYASSRLASYGWGADQMKSLDILWDEDSDWRTSQVDSRLAYIKERYGSPAKALEFRKANKSY